MTGNKKKLNLPDDKRYTQMLKLVHGQDRQTTLIQCIPLYSLLRAMDTVQGCTKCVRKKFASALWRLAFFAHLEVFDLNKNSTN